MSSTYLRFLSRNKLYTFIEVFGLSVALGFVILLASYAKTEFVLLAKEPGTDAKNQLAKYQKTVVLVQFN